MENRKINAEKKRLEALLEYAEVSQKQRDALAPVIENMAWQRLKLSEAREQMNDADIVCHYDNGGGQSGERENPIFKAYVNLWRSYMIGFEKYLSFLPKDLQDEVSASDINILDKVIAAKKGNA